MNLESWWHLKELIEAKTGWLIREQDQKKFLEVLAARIRHHRLTSPEEFGRLLRDHAHTGAPEWQKLASLVAVGETYFFRDKGQFTVLREQIFPELIAARQAEKSLKIWSAGCSSGEEPYSLAIILDKLLPRQTAWRVRILAIDLNGEAIDKARRGIYSPWSFRMCPAELQRDYFTARKEVWEIDERIRDLVTFRCVNLLDLPEDLASEIQEVDLIICRNVFIYFKKEAIAQTLDRFSGLLRPGGFLMTGHGELHGQGLELDAFQTRVYEGSIIYQKIAAEARQSASPALDAVRPTEVAAKSPGSKTKSAVVPRPLRIVKKPRQSPAAETSANSQANAHPKNFEALYLLAQAYADRGQYEQAASLCVQMLQAKSQMPQPYFLLAHLAEAQGDREEAKKLFKKVIYLDPCFVAAYLELSGLYAREQDKKRAGILRQIALKILLGMAPDQVVEPYQGVTAGELIGLLKGEGEAGHSARKEE